MIYDEQGYDEYGCDVNGHDGLRERPANNKARDFERQVRQTTRPEQQTADIESEEQDDEV